MRYFFLVVFLFLFTLPIKAQNNEVCINAKPFCAGSSVLFPANTDKPWAVAGANYGCLAAQPNPAWFFSKISIAGYHKILIESTNYVDIDFALWGPFAPNTSLSTICNTISSGNLAPVNCSYSTAPIEVINFTSNQADEIWIMLITNFSNEPTNIKIDQVEGSGLMDCSILPCSEIKIVGDEKVCTDDHSTSTYTATASNASRISYSLTPTQAGNINSTTGVVTWNTSFSGTATIKATASYSNCTDMSASINVSVHSKIEVSLSASDTSVCFGAPVVFTATPSQGFFDFRVNGISKQYGSSNTFRTTFVTDNERVSVIRNEGETCYATSNEIAVRVSKDVLPFLFLSSSTITICKGEPITFTANEGLSNYDFRINKISVQNSPSNTFTSTTLSNNDTVSVFSTNEACPAFSNQIRIFVDEDYDLNLVASDTLICEGDEVTFSAYPSYFNSYDFRINGQTQQKSEDNTFVSNSLSDGDTVSFKPSSARCNNFSNPVRIRVKPKPQVTLSTTKTTIFEDETLLFTANIENFPNENISYIFKVNDIEVQKGTSNTFMTNTLINEDKITVEVIKNKCKNISNSIKITVLKESLGIYPNPTPNTFIYNIPIEVEENYQIRLFDAIGRLIWEDTKTKEGKLIKGTVNLEKQARGMYIFQVSNSDKVMNFKVIKE